MRLLPGKAPGQIPNCPVPVALKMLLQIATRNIGQLTDIERSPRHSPAPRRGPGWLVVSAIAPDRADRGITALE
jgi:hypothetical protein